jgi:hypothetical protein
MSVVLTSTTDSPNEVLRAFDAAGLTVETLDVTTNQPEPEQKETEATSDAPAAEAAEGKTAAATEATDEVQDETKGEDGEPPKRQRGVQKRIDELTRERYERDGKLAAQSERIAELEKRIADAAKPAPVAEPEPEPESTPERVAAERPKLADFEDYEQFTEALLDWKAGQREAKLLARIDDLQEKIDQRAIEADAKSAAKQAVDSRTAEWQKRCDEVAPDYPDWEEKGKAAAKIPFNPVMSDALFEREAGPRLMYYLASNPEVAQKLFEATNYDAKATPAQIIKANRTAGREVARIEALIASSTAKADDEPEPDPAATPIPAKQKPVTSAPAPIRPPRGGAPASEKDPYKGPLLPHEYRAWRQAHPNG